MRKSRCTDEQIVAILQEAERTGKSGEGIRRHGISRETFYRWRKKYGGMQVSDAKRLRALEKATLSLHPAWVEKGRSGRRNTWLLTPRGRAIVERSVPAHLRGEGPYEGLAPWGESSKARRQQECLHARIEAMGRDHDGREFLARLECAMFAWSCFFGPTSMASAYAHENNKRVLRGFLQRYLVRHGAMPQGIHDVGSISLHSSRVDFDLLVGPLPSGRSRAALVNTSRHIIMRASSNFDVSRLRALARAGAEWRDYGLVCEPTVVPEVLRALNA